MLTYKTVVWNSKLKKLKWAVESNYATYLLGEPLSSNWLVVGLLTLQLVPWERRKVKHQKINKRISSIMYESVQYEKSLHRDVN